MKLLTKAITSASATALGVVLFATLTAAHAQHPDTRPFFVNGATMYVMVPVDKARDKAFITRVAEEACGSRSTCYVSVWAESLDKPDGAQHHPRYDENKLAEYQRNRGTGVALRVLFNRRFFQCDLNTQCMN